MESNDSLPVEFRSKNSPLASRCKVGIGSQGDLVVLYEDVLVQLNGSITELLVG